MAACEPSHAISARSTARTIDPTVRTYQVDGKGRINAVLHGPSNLLALQTAKHAVVRLLGTTGSSARSSPARSSPRRPHGQDQGIWPKMKSQGLLTEEEFAAEKARILFT